MIILTQNYLDLFPNRSLFPETSQPSSHTATHIQIHIYICTYVQYIHKATADDPSGLLRPNERDFSRFSENTCPRHRLMLVARIANQLHDTPDTGAASLIFVCRFMREMRVGLSPGGMATLWGGGGIYTFRLIPHAEIFRPLRVCGF